jgi:hypothetical protein
MKEATQIYAVVLEKLSASPIDSYEIDVLKVALYFQTNREIFRFLTILFLLPKKRKIKRSIKVPSRKLN